MRDIIYFSYQRIVDIDIYLYVLFLFSGNDFEEYTINISLENTGIKWIYDTLTSLKEKSNVQVKAFYGVVFPISMLILLRFKS